MLPCYLAARTVQQSLIRSIEPIQQYTQCSNIFSVSCIHEVLLNLKLTKIFTSQNPPKVELEFVQESLRDRMPFRCYQFVF